MRITYTMRAQTVFFVINISFIIFTFRLYFFYFMAIVVDLFYLLICLDRLQRYVFIRPEGLRLHRRLEGRSPTGKQLI